MLWDLDIRAVYDPRVAAVCVYMTRREGDQLHLLNGPDTFSLVEPKASILPNPTLELSDGNAQALCDALASIGIRPSEESREQQKAVQAHLDDLRRIVFKGLMIEP